MKRLLWAVAAIALIAPAAAAAEPQHGHHGSRGAAHHERHMSGGHMTRHMSHQHHNVRMGHPHRTHTVTVYRVGHRPATFHRVHARHFVYPHGYSYRRWHTGVVLPRVFLSNNYYWSDWRALGLLPPPPGFVWVRVGPDLLLVNVRTGRIADVIYGAFY